MQPNILFFLPDQHRPDWLGNNPDLPLRTPNLDRLAERGIQFTRAFTPSPLCGPARACLATGRYYEHCGVRDNHQNTPLSLPTYYRRLRDTGYNVCGVGKFDLHKADDAWGNDGTLLLDEYGFSSGMDSEGKVHALHAYEKNGRVPKSPYIRFLNERGLLEKHVAMHETAPGKSRGHNFTAVTELPEDAYCDNWVAANGLKFLRDFPRGRPWHLVFNFVGPHGPFDVTPAMLERWKDAAIPPPVDNVKAADPDTVVRRRHYAAMIENIDMHLGRMLEVIEQRGEMENTIVVYSSDHGEMLGDHGRLGKGVWFTPATGIPLIIAGPGIRRGVRSDALVMLQDLAATFLEYAGAVPLPDGETRSLAPVLAGQSARHRDCVFSALNQWRMVFDGRFKLVLGADPSPLLYDLETDPHEMRNVAGRHPGKVAELSEKLAARGALAAGNK